MQKNSLVQEFYIASQCQSPERQEATNTKKTAAISGHFAVKKSYNKTVGNPVAGSTEFVMVDNGLIMGVVTALTSFNCAMFFWMAFGTSENGMFGTAFY